MQFVVVLSSMKRVLIAEDNLDLRSFLSGILLTHNYQVRSTANKMGLQNYLQSYEPDIILLDVLLGEDDGREICREIKNEHKEVVIILISANPMLLNDYTIYNADDTIEKPFGVGNLLDKIRDVQVKA
jgi:DNA-binding response OmpR family regulator